MAATISIPPAATDSAKLYRPRGAARELFPCYDRELLIEGPAGTGKTRGVLEKVNRRLLKHPGSRALICRKTRASMTESVLVTYESHVIPANPLLYPQVDSVGRENRWSYKYPNGSTLVVGGLDRPVRLMSTEYDMICFPGETQVFSPSEIIGASKREYSGEFVTIQTAAGNELTGTPNHPILTDRGWVALGCLNDGDNVVGCRPGKDVGFGADPDVDHRVATIAEVAAPLLLSGSGRTKRVKAVPMNFHGDGAGGDVDVVTTARLFNGGFDTALGEHPSELLRERRDLQAQSLMGVGSPELVKLAMGAAPGGGPCQRRDSFDVFPGLGNSLAGRFGAGCREPLHKVPVSGVGEGGDARVMSIARAQAADQQFVLEHFGADPVLGRHGFEPSVATQVVDDGSVQNGGRDYLPPITHHRGGAGRANGDPSLGEFELEGGGADAQAGRNRSGALAGDILLDRVVHVRRSYGKCHVYNLQTGFGWYVANGIIAHNCAFEATELTENDWELLLTRLRNGVMPIQQAIADCNPGPPSHWLNARANRPYIVPPHLAEYLPPARPGQTQMTRLLSRHVDNPSLYDADSGRWTQRGAEYLGTLNGLGGARKLRLLNGVWAAQEGLVYEDFDAAAHVIKPFAIPAEWRRIRVIDFGYTNPFVCQWWAIDPDGRMFLYREIYRTQTLVEDHAKRINELSGEETFEATIADHDAEDRATLERHGIWTGAAHKAVETGLEAVKARLRKQKQGDGTEKPRLFLFEDALVEQDPALVAAKKPLCTRQEFDGYAYAARQDGKPNKEEPVKVDDHGMDTMRYAVAYVDDIGSQQIEWIAGHSA